VVKTLIEKNSPSFKSKGSIAKFGHFTPRLGTDVLAHPLSPSYIGSGAPPCVVLVQCFSIFVLELNHFGRINCSLNLVVSSLGFVQIRNGHKRRFPVHMMHEKSTE